MTEPVKRRGRPPKKPLVLITENVNPESTIVQESIVPESDIVSGNISAISPEPAVIELPNLSEPFVCPLDKAPLVNWVCPTCGRKYDQFEGIPVLTPPQLREGVQFDNYKYLDNPVDPKWNAGEVTTVGFVNAQIAYEETLKVRTFSGDRYRFFRDNASGVILDAGCNCGGVTNILKGEKVFGLDFLVTHLLRARRECHEGITWVNAGAEYMPFPDNYFDTVCLGEMMEHVPNPIRPVLEAIRVLKPGGIMLIVNQNKPVEFRPQAVRETINPCNPEQLKAFLDIQPIEIVSFEVKEGGGGLDPNGIFVKAKKR